MKKNVIIMGKGDLAVKVANWFLNSDKYEIKCVVPNSPESTWTIH